MNDSFGKMESFGFIVSWRVVSKGYGLVDDWDHATWIPSCSLFLKASIYLHSFFPTIFANQSIKYPASFPPLTLVPALSVCILPFHFGNLHIDLMFSILSSLSHSPIPVLIIHKSNRKMTSVSAKVMTESTATKLKVKKGTDTRKIT